MAEHGYGDDPEWQKAQRRRALRRGAVARSRGGPSSVEVKVVVLDLGGVVVPTLFEVVPEQTEFPNGPFGRDTKYSDVEIGKTPEREYWAELASARPDLDLDDYMRTYVDVRDEIHDLFRGLGGRVRLAALTNDMAHWFGRTWRDKFPAFTQFDFLLESSTSGALKPNPAVFRWAAEQIGEPPETCLFVDDLPANLRGADAVGMRTSFFDITDPAGSVRRILDAVGIEDDYDRSPRVFRAGVS